jgi:hypothetical protein
MVSLATGEGSRQKESSKSYFIPIPVLRTLAVAGGSLRIEQGAPARIKIGRSFTR